MISGTPTSAGQWMTSERSYRASWVKASRLDRQIQAACWPPSTTITDHQAGQEGQNYTLEVTGNGEGMEALDDLV